MPLKVPLPRQKRLQQQLLLRQTQSQQVSEVDGDENYDVVEIDLHRGFSRPKLVNSNLWDDDVELPDYITNRLEFARMLALVAYHNKYVL